MKLATETSQSQLTLEVKATLQLAVPLVISQILEAGITLLDAVMMGWLGSQSLAAGALGAITFSTLAIVCSCSLSGVGVIAANAFGAGNLDDISRANSQGLWLAAIISLPAMLLLWNFDYILLLTNQEPANVFLAKTYLQAIVWGFPAVIGFSILKEVSSALHRPQLISIIMVVGLLLNGFANYVLAFGKFGLPAFGLAGIGWASTIVLWLNFIVSCAWLLFHAHFRDYQLFSHLFKFDQEMLVNIFQTGWLLGLQFGAETGVFTGIALVIGSFGTAILAAHEIAIETVHFVQMIPIGISYATMMRVGQFNGQNDTKGASRAGFVGIALVLPITCIVSLIFWLFPNYVVAMYVDINNSENTEIIQMATSFLSVAAIVQTLYSIQAISASALVGLKDTTKPMLINIFAYWIIGFSSGYLMAVQLGWGSIGLWWGLVLGLIVVAIALTWRFYILTLKEKNKIYSLTESI